MSSRVLVTCVGTALFGIGLVSAAPARAIDATYPVTTVRVISDENGNSRVLLGYRPGNALSEELILSATLVIPLSGNTPLSRIGVEVTGLTTAWSAGATWTRPWTTPGGDIDPALSSSATVRTGRAATTLELDVTDMVRAVVDGEADANGLLLRPEAPRHIGFNAAEMAVLGALQGAEVQVTYRSLKAHGIRGGAKRLAERRRAAVANSGG